MQPRTTINYSVTVETREHIEAMAEKTHRSPGYLMDFIVEQAWARFQVENPETPGDPPDSSEQNPEN
jgi:hypothetical protein